MSIRESESFIWIEAEEERFPYETDEEYLKHSGKWMIYEPKEQIEEKIPKIIEMLGDKRILNMKYTKNPALDVPENYSLGEDYALIIYCDDRQRDEVRKVIKNELGSEEMFWKYDRQTLKEKGLL